MFSNFIYFIIALLIYTTYQPSAEPNLGTLKTLFLFISLIALFSYFTRIQFQAIRKQIRRETFSSLDHRFNAVLTRQSVLAIVLFAIDVYGLGLSSFFKDITIFSIIPTFQALIFIALFVCYLSIVWICAHAPYQGLYNTDISMRSYVFSNILFSIPVLLPWLILSGISDIILAIPFEAPKLFLSTTEGEVIYFVVFLFVIAIIGPRMIQKFWRCKPLESGYHRNRIERLCEKAGLQYANILYWPIFGGKMITAGVMGLTKKFRYILVTNALLRLLEPVEIDAVIAHEIGHVKKKHLLFYLVFFVGYLLLSYAIFDLIIYFILYVEPIYRFLSNAGIHQTTVTSTLFSLIIIFTFLIYFRYIFGYFMRNFERQADVYVYSVFDTAIPLITTLGKIAATSGQPDDRPNWHHFSIRDRIDYLKKCEADRKWIKRQDRKIRKSILLYLLVILLISGVGYHLNFGETGKKINQQFIITMIQREIEKTPDSPKLFSILGDLWYSRQNYERTIKAYKKALTLLPDSPQVLNNLAWLYATCEDERYRNPKQAIALAKRAAALSESPHVLDTLAESHYVNGQFEEAISASKNALDMAKKNRGDYEKQLGKFIEGSK